MKNHTQIICCCDGAERNCYLTCAKGRRLNPDQVYNIPQWKKKVKGK